MNMKNRLAKMEYKLKKVVEELETLQCKNEALKCRNMMPSEDAVLSQVDRAEGESQARVGYSATMKKRGKCTMIYRASWKNMKKWRER